MRHVERHPKSGVFRVRIPVPPRLRPVLQQSAYTRTLNTKVRREAERAAHAVIADFQRRLDAAEASVVAITADGPASSALLSPASAAAAIRAWATEAEVQITDAIWRNGWRACLRHVIPEFGSGGPNDFVRENRLAYPLSYVCEASRAFLDENDERMASLLRRVLGRAGLVTPPGRHPITEGARALLWDAVEHLGKHQDRLRYGEWTLTATAAAPSPTSAPCMLPQPAPDRLAPQMRPATLKDFLDEFFAEGRAASPSTQSEVRLAVRRLLNYLEREDTLLHGITYEDAKGFRDALLHMPLHMTEADYKRGIRQVAQDHLEGRDQRPRITRQTVGKCLRLLLSIMNLAVKRGRIERHPFGGLTLKGALRSKRRRRPFDPREVEAIFSSPVFMGCASPSRWWEPGSHLLDDHRYWIPLIAFTMGVRLEEAGQLCTTDVAVMHGVPCLSITERDGADDDDDDTDDESLGEGDQDTAARLKTESSRRFVPLNPVLVELGFLRLVERQRRAGEPRLFPELSRNGIGKLTASVSKWFNGRLLPKVGIVDRAKRFHSLRHCFADNARNTREIKPDVRQALMGHSSGAAHDNYGDGFSMTTLREAVDALVLPGLPVERLVAARANR
jgi:integrase